MRLIEGITLWGGVLFYLLSFLFFLWEILFKQERQTSMGWKGFLVAFCLHSATILVRWVEAGHPPVLWTYEHALASSWCISLVFILASKHLPLIRVSGVAVAPVILLILGYGIMAQGVDIEPLPPPYKSNWLVVHVTFAWLAYSIFAFSAVLAIVQLLKRWSLKVPGGGILEKLPSPERLDDFTFRIIIYGFVSLAIEMGAGAIWAYGLWGRYWAWDPMETWTLVSWLTYGLYLHLRVSLGWRGVRMAWLVIIAFIFVFITFGGIAYMRGLHAPLV